MWSHRTLLTSLDNGGVLALALAVDLALFIPGLFYVLVVRPRGWPLGALVPIVTVGLLTSHALVPAQLRASLTALWAFPLIVEGALLTWIASRAAVAARGFRRRGQGDAPADVLGAAQAAMRAVLGKSQLAEALAYELALLYYALVSWRRSPPAWEGDRFTCYRRNGYSALLLGLGLVVVCEEILLHVVLHNLWSAKGAWVVTAFGAYGLIWFFGDWQALRRRALELTPSALELRVGLRWDLTIPYDRVTDLRRLTGYSHKPLPV